MSQTTIFGVGALYLVLLTFYMHRNGAGPGVRTWGIAWACMWASGLLVALADRATAARFAYPLVGTVFAALLWAGAREFAGRPLPQRFYAWALGVGLLRSALQAITSNDVAQITGAGLVTAATCGAALETWRARRSPTELMLALTFPVLGIVACLHAAARVRGAPLDPWLLGWFTTALLLILLQTAAVVGRVLRRSEELVVEGERRAAALSAERSRIERAHARLEALVDSVPFGLMLTDASGRILAANRGFPILSPPSSPESWIGRSADAYLALLAERLVPADRDLAAIELLASPAATLKEREIRLVDGRVALARVESVRSEDGTPIGRLWTLRDVTEERRTQQRLRQVEQLEKLGELAGGVAHDFNNQITVVLGNGEILRSAVQRDAVATRALEDLEQAARHCSALTRDLLDFSRRSPRSPSLIALDGFLAEWRGRQRPQLPPWIKLDLDVEPGTPSILADATQLERVLTNLLLNARDAIEGEGRIVVSARPVAHGDATPQEVARVEIAVSDDGSGIDASTRERIFDPFFSTKPTGAGVGLGLAIVYGIVTSYGGSVEVRSEPGRGSRFATFWPAAPAGSSIAADAALDATRASRSTGSECVLVAEDEPAVRRLVTRALAGAGYRVLEAADGEEAVARWREHADEISILVFDLSMRGGSGAEAITHIRALAPSIPAILMSGHLASELAGSLPADVVRLAKPFRFDELCRVVRASLDAQSGGRG